MDATTKQPACWRSCFSLWLALKFQELGVWGSVLLIGAFEIRFKEIH
jgi:hypothetical protein